MGADEEQKEAVNEGGGSDRRFQAGLVLIHELIGTLKDGGDTVVAVVFCHAAGDDNSPAAKRLFIMGGDGSDQFVDPVIVIALGDNGELIPADAEDGAVLECPADDTAGFAQTQQGDEPDGANGQQGFPEPDLIAENSVTEKRMNSNISNSILRVLSGSNANPQWILITE